MIAAHELRIGNKVLHGQVVHTVSGIVQTDTAAQIYLDKNEKAAPLKLFQPLPLTSELLERCWFEESDVGFWWEHITATIYLQKTNRRWDFSLTDPREVAYWKCMNGLHQLQNLHFAVTGTELEINF